ncbi:purine-nucleoside phosphorylase [Ruminococcus sp. FC2018]|uniref:purine-nucleoside phosphorylase n=1 Tax=Ruminococcus sp. FC2018 TaxID=1410617 RepID=UPI00048EB305|nr:purine-nucleoside phosphorylase [Ruminococcus sp. FC2018]
MIDYEALRGYVEKIGSRIGFAPKIGIVLGSGLGELADKMQSVYSISYMEIEGFPVSTVEDHVGQYVFGYIEDVPVVCMQGRVHYYEGYTMEEVVLPIRFMGMLGVEQVILTNAAGGISADFDTGDIVLLSDHIATFVPNPLIGYKAVDSADRFPDMTQVYDKGMREVMKSVAKEQNTTVKEGVYIQLTGPSYETPAEIKMAGLLGADIVGMSTACEAIAARHSKMKVCAISYVSNPAAGLGDVPLSHEDVKKQAKKTAGTVAKLIKGYCKAVKEQ